MSEPKIPDFASPQMFLLWLHDTYPPDVAKRVEDEFFRRWKPEPSPLFRYLMAGEKRKSRKQRKRERNKAWRGRA